MKCGMTFMRQTGVHHLTFTIPSDRNTIISDTRHRMISKFTYIAQNLIVFLLVYYFRPAYKHTRSQRTLNNAHYELRYCTLMRQTGVHHLTFIIPSDRNTIISDTRHRMISKFTYIAQNLIVFLLVYYFRPAYKHTRSQRTLNNPRYEVRYCTMRQTGVHHLTFTIPSDRNTIISDTRHRMISKFTYIAQNLIVFLLVYYFRPAYKHTRSQRTLNNAHYEVRYDVYASNGRSSFNFYKSL